MMPDMVGSGYIRGCEFSFKCPKLWDALQRTAFDGVRHCESCNRVLQPQRPSLPYR